MNALSVFSFQENHPIRVVMVDGNPWFVANDICNALSIQNVTQAMRAYERELLRDVVRGGQRSMSCGELPITDIDTELEKVLPAHFELAIEKLETLSTKLTVPVVTDK